MAEANIKSIEGLESFAGAIARLREGTRKNADEIQEQLYRISAWLEKEIPEYWANQFRIAEIRWVEAREDLLRCQAKTRAEDEVSCLVQKKAFERAKARRKLCEEKLRCVSQWRLRWEQHFQECMLSVRQLDDLHDTRLPRAESQLHQAIETLKRYLTNTTDPGG